MLKRTIFFETVKRSFFSLDTFLIFAFASFFYLVFYALPYDNQVITKIPTAIVDMDQSEHSRELALKIESAPSVQTVLKTANLNEAVDAFKQRSLDVIVVIPTDYSRDLSRAEQTTISIFSNGAMPVKGRAVSASVLAIAAQENIGSALSHAVKAGLNPLVVKQMQLQPPSMVSQDLFNNISGYGYYTVPMVAVVIIQAVMLYGVGIGLGGWISRPNRLPFVSEAFRSPNHFLFIAAGFFAISLFWGLMIEGLGLSLLGMPTLENASSTLLALICFSLSVSSLAVFITLLMGNNRYAVCLTLASAPSVFLSGMIYPMESFANWVIPIAWMIPSTPACKAIVFASQEGATVSAIAPYLSASLLQFAFFSFGIVYLLKTKYCKYPNSLT